jgi:hypothetical protein
MDTRTLPRNVGIRLLNIVYHRNRALVRSCLSLWVEAFAFLVQLCCDGTNASVIGSGPDDVIRNVKSIHILA